jgi:hypothetical protein
MTNDEDDLDTCRAVVLAAAVGVVLWYFALYFVLILVEAFT